MSYTPIFILGQSESQRSFAAGQGTTVVCILYTINTYQSEHKSKKPIQKSSAIFSKSQGLNLFSSLTTLPEDKDWSMVYNWSSTPLYYGE